MRCKNNEQIEQKDRSYNVGSEEQKNTFQAIGTCIFAKEVNENDWRNKKVLRHSNVQESPLFTVDN